MAKDEGILAQGKPRRRWNGQRLFDKLDIAFDQACDDGEFEVAEALLKLFELLMARPVSVARHDRRALMENLVASHEHLWAARQKLQN